MTQERKIDTVGLIISAGRGHRFGGEKPKQYLSIQNEIILTKTINVFAASPKIDAIRVVIHPDDSELYKAATKGIRLLKPVFGGAERQDSVLSGLNSLDKINPSKVIIHDAVRPFVTLDLIESVTENTTMDTGCIPGTPAGDTLKLAKNNFVIDTVDRSNLLHVQTPQGFPFKRILDAHRILAGRNFTDDSSVAETHGIPVCITQGSTKNIKITHKEDVWSYKDLSPLKYNDIRIGNGFDVHQFKEGSYVTICGVKIPHIASLEGHSDADVGFHALTDAILGAIGKGDIGEHFSPNDNKWKNASSDLFVKFARNLLDTLGGQILNLDITIICEEPRIGKYRNQMKSKVSAILGVDISRINIKGTTTEGLGFLGRREGIAAQATTSVALK